MFFSPCESSDADKLENPNYSFVMYANRGINLSTRLSEVAMYLIFNILVVWKDMMNFLKQVCRATWKYNAY